MTAPAVVPATTTPAASRAASSGSRESSAGTERFDRQLHAARQQREPAQDSADASSRQSSHASKSSHADDLPPSVSPEAITDAAAVATTSNSHQATPGRDADVDGDQAGAALAGSMLALLGLSSGVALMAATTTNGGAATSAGAGTGKTVASDASAAGLLLANALDSGVAATATGTALLGLGMQPAGDDVGRPAIDKAADHVVELASSGLALPAAITTAAPLVTHQLQLPSPVGSRSFAQELGQQVVWLAGQDVKQARIRLHPEELGQLDVKINVSHDRVDVVFSAQHPAAVTAIQQSLSQLGQMLTQQGLSLGHAEVGQHDRGEYQGRGSAAPNDAVVDDTDDVHGIGLRTSIGAVGLLDAFA